MDNIRCKNCDDTGIVINRKIFIALFENGSFISVKYENLPDRGRGHWVTGLADITPFGAPVMIGDIEKILA